MFSQPIVTKYQRKKKKLWNLPSISELWISILEALYTCSKDIRKLTKSVLSSPLSLLEHQRPELKNNTTFGRESYSITFVCMVENKKGGQSIFFCFWALNKYPWSHIHLQQGSSKAQKACTVITSVSAYISEIGVEKQHDIYQYASKFYSLKSSSLF